MRVNTILKGDNIEILKSLPDASVDCIFADPPYFMQTSGELIRADGSGAFKGCDDDWDKYNSYAEYDRYTEEWLRECKRVLKDTGTIWVIGAFQNIYRVGYIMQNLGFWILNDVVWFKTNPVPNFKGTRFQNSNETMLWCSKSEKSKFTFNYKTMKHLNGGKQEKSVWQIPICQGNERIKDENGEKLHTTQKPEALLERVILASTKPGDVVLDPFFGTGTTGAVAKRLGRNYLGIEREEKYIKGAEERINNVEVETNDITNLSLEVKPPKVPMPKLLELGMLKEGTSLYNSKSEEICKVLSNGNVVDKEGIELSIHKMTAKVQGKKNANGWGYFYLYEDNEFITLDSLRYKVEKL